MKWGIQCANSIHTHTHTHIYIIILFFYICINAPSSFINCRLLKHLEVPFVFHVRVHSLCVPSSFPPLPSLTLSPPFALIQPPTPPPRQRFCSLTPSITSCPPFPLFLWSLFFISDPVLGGVSRAPSESHPCMAERRPIPAGERGAWGAGIEGERGWNGGRNRERGGIHVPVSKPPGSPPPTTVHQS